MRVNNRYQKQKPKRNMSIIKPLNIHFKKMQSKLLCQNSQLFTFPFASLPAKVPQWDTIKLRRRRNESVKTRVRRRSAKIRGQKCDGGRKGAILLSLLRRRNLALSPSQVRTSVCVCSSLSFKDNFSYKMASDEEE